MSLSLFDRPAMVRARIDLLVAVLLTALVLASYWPVTAHQFVEFDDTDYIVYNPPVRNGLSGESVVWAFTQSHSANWHPLTWLSHMVDCTLFGLDAGRHHVTALAIHLLNSLLLYFALRALLDAGRALAAPALEAAALAKGRGRAQPVSRANQPALGEAWCCGLVAALFAIHPLHVESVAWLSERKDLLSGFFWMATLWAYAWYVRQPASWGRYLAVMGLFALGLMSKPMVVTLPAVLLLLDLWPLGRWRLRDAPLPWQILPPWPLLREKLPLAALVVASSVITFFAQRAGGAVVKMEGLSTWHRFSNALWSYFDYLAQMVWPLELAFFYPHPTAFGQPMDNTRTLWVGVVLVAITVAAVVLRRRWPFVLVGWLWYLGTLVPVIGLVQVGDQARADRYTYIPSIGISLIVVFGGAALIAWLAARTSRGLATTVAAAVSVAVLAACVVLTQRQKETWRDTAALAENGLRVTGVNNYMCHFLLGVAAERKGELEAARGHYYESLKYNDHNSLTLHNLARLLVERDEAAAAEQICRKLVGLRPDLIDAQVLWAASLEAQERYPEAEAILRKLIDDPASALDGYSSLVLLLGHQNKVDEALALLDMADRRFGTQAELLLSRGSILRQVGRLEEAEQTLLEAARLSKNPIRTLALLADVQLAQGRIEAVIATYRRMVQESPGDQKTQLALATLLEQAGRTTEAIAELRAFLQRYPGHPNAANNLAWILATHRDPRFRNGLEAVALALQACRVPANVTPELLDTLAAAYAESGQFADAVRTAQEAIRRAQAANRSDVVRDIETRLRLYQAGQAFHAA